MENDEILQDEEIQTTFNEDTIEELNEDNEVEYSYAGNSRDRDADIKYFKEKYKEEIVEYLQPREEKKKKKELPMTGLSPIMPDKEKGIDTFNKNASPDIGAESSGEVSGGSGE